MNSKLGLTFLILLSWKTLLLADAEAIAFHRPDFRGERLIIVGEWTVHYRGAPWNDAINALSVPRGYEAILYEHADFQGARIVVRGDWSAYDDPAWHNRISSIQILPLARRPHDCISARCRADCPRYSRPGDGGHRGRHGPAHRYRRPPPEVLLFRDTDFRGPLLRLRSDWSASCGNDYWNDSVSSIRVPRGYALIVYEHAGFQGRSFIIRGNWSAWGFRDFWNDRISSVRLIRE